LKDASRKEVRRMPVIRRLRRAETTEKVLDVDASMQGTMVFKDPVNLRINGEFDGRLDTKGTLTIGENARVKADINGEDITIAGTVVGSITATKRLNIVAPADITGDIKTPLLSISEGATVNGRCQMPQVGEWQSTGRGHAMALDEVARYLEVEQSLVEEWAAQRKIPATKENNAWRFFKEEIDSWIAKEKVNT
jgi:excisionase family DNA binding protein